MVWDCDEDRNDQVNRKAEGRKYIFTSLLSKEVLMSKVTFIEPASSFNGYAFAAKLPLMGPLYLGTILAENGHDVSILNENFSSAYNQETGWLHKSLLTADVVGISTITSTADRAYKIADAVREQNKNAKLIIGGAHASFMEAESLEHADIVVKGEAESIICDLVDGNGNLPKSGVVEGRIVEDLSSLPIPDIDLLENKLKPRMLGVLPHTAPICTSRGCPYDCTFCSVTQMFGRKYRFNSAEKVIEELKIRFQQGFRRFFFYDDNFTASKDRAKSLLDGILTNNLKFSWLAQTRVDVAKDDELLKLMARSKCRWILVGFESVNPKTLEAYNKKQEVKDIQECIRRLQKHNIKVHGMFVLGSDEDDVQTIEDTVKFCNDMHLDAAQFSILFPIPGTKLYTDLDTQGRIFTKNWSLYDGTHVVFVPKKMSFLQLQEKFIWAWKKFYSIGKFEKYLIRQYIMRKWEKCNKQFHKWLQELQKKMGQMPGKSEL